MEFNEKEVSLIERTFVITGVFLAIIFCLVWVAVALWPAAAEAADKPVEAKHSYIGVEKCGMCHKADAKGNQLKQWQASKHAHAYHTLATKEAKEIAEKAGVKGDPQKAPECLKCHVTAFNVDKALLGEKFKMEDGIQCEVCHGPGGDYMKLPIMKDKKKAIENGLMVPTEETCKRCHNDSAPGFKGFDFKAASKKIAHKRPEKKEASAGKTK